MNLKIVLRRLFSGKVGRIGPVRPELPERDIGKLLKIELDPETGLRKRPREKR
jgi:hypothetical protein